MPDPRKFEKSRHRNVVMEDFAHDVNMMTNGSSAPDLEKVFKALEQVYVTKDLRVQCNRCKGEGELHGKGWVVDEFRAQARKNGIKTCFGCRSRGWFKLPPVERYAQLVLAHFFYADRMGYDDLKTYEVFAKQLDHLRNRKAQGPWVEDLYQKFLDIEELLGTVHEGESIEDEDIWVDHFPKEYDWAMASVGRYIDITRRGVIDQTLTHLSNLGVSRSMLDVFFYLMNEEWK